MNYFLQKKLKFLYVLNADWYFSLHWFERALYMIELGYEVHLAVPVQSEIIKKDLESKGILVHDFQLDRTSTGVLKEIKSIIALRSILKEVKPDLVHSVTIKPNLYVAFLAVLDKFNYVSTYAGLGTLISSRAIKHRLVRFFVFKALKYFYKNAKNFILFENEDDMSFFQKNKISDHLRMERVFGAGVDCNKFAYSLPNKNYGELKVLFASRLLKSKGLDYAVSAVKNLRFEGLNIKLVVAGIVDNCSPLAYSKEELDVLVNERCVEWLGERKDVNFLIENSDVVVLPTTYGEGVPRILIEACAIGRPIITTAIGGCKDICIDSKNGFIVRPSSTDDIVTSLKFFAENPDSLISMGRFGRDLVENKFSNEKIFTSHISVYSKLL